MDERISKLLSNYAAIFALKGFDDDRFRDLFVEIASSNVPGEGHNRKDLDKASGDVNVVQLLDDNDFMNIGEEAEVPTLVPTRKESVDDGGLRDDFIESRYLGELSNIVTASFPGSPSPVPSATSSAVYPPADALAFYLPFHYFPEQWGIYIIHDGHYVLSDILYSRLTDVQKASVTKRDAKQAALIYLFHHEAYHSAAEGFAIRAELISGASVYKTGLQKMYDRAWNPPLPHEELLATAYGFRKLKSSKAFGSSKALQYLLLSLQEYIENCPAQYALGAQYQSDDQFEDLQQQFLEDSMRISSGNTRALHYGLWDMSQHIMTPLLQRNKRYSWLIDRQSFSKSSLSVRYFRQRDVVRCLERVFAVRREPAGKHNERLVRTLDKTSRHKPGKTALQTGEIPFGTVQKMLRDLDIPINADEFRKVCRKEGYSVNS